MNELLEYIAAKSGCKYISDVHMSCYFSKIQQVISQMDPSAYSLKEWNDAVQYITGKAVNFDTSGQAVDFLVSKNVSAGCHN